MSHAAAEPPSPAPASWRLPIALIVATFGSTLWVGAEMALEEPIPWDALPGFLATRPWELMSGWVFAVPLMAILLAHEFGHYVAGRLHGVDISPPYFIPIPAFLLGTMGAVIRMRGAIRTRDALLDVGAAGPLAGMAVAIPVLVYGIHTSPVLPLPAEGGYIVEGRSILYLALMYALKGPIPDGHDIFLTPTALAGWAGLLVTMINMLPVGQLDGGHIAYALWGPKQDVRSERLRRVLPLLGVVVGLAYVVPSWLGGTRGFQLLYDGLAGVQWVVWAAVLWLMTRAAGPKHPPTGPEPLSPRRRWVAIGTLVMFALLFMPSWVRIVG